MVEVEQKGTAEVLVPLMAGLETLGERWSGKTLADINAEQPQPDHVGVSSDHHVEKVTLDPVDGEYDGTDIVIPLHFMQGWTPHHYIGARIVQELVFPNSRVTILPNAPDSVPLDDEDKKKMAMGINVLTEYQMLALEKLGLGTTALLGFSYGGLTTLRLAGHGSDRLEIVKINADEVPHEEDRGPLKLMRDFDRSSGIPRLKQAIASSGIPPLSEAMDSVGITIDVLRFSKRAALSKEGRLMGRDMTGTHNDDIARAVHQLGGSNVKLGYIDGSSMFNIDDLDLLSTYTPIAPRVGPRIVHYFGEDFYAHAAVDNPILRAGLAYDGLHH